MMFEKNSYLKFIKLGSLVIPKKTIYLTPIEDPEDKDWIEWSERQFGIVVNVRCRIAAGYNICVMTPRGVGICLFDEIKFCS